jgi:hypothetical protein
MENVMGVFGEENDGMQWEEFREGEGRRQLLAPTIDTPDARRAHRRSNGMGADKIHNYTQLLFNESILYDRIIACTYKSNTVPVV